MSKSVIAYWMVQPLGRRKFYSLSEAEAIAETIKPLRKVHVVAYNASGKGIP